MFSFTGSVCGLANLQIDKSGSARASGGGIDFTDAGQDIHVDDIYFGNGLYTSLNVAPGTEPTRR